MNLLDGKLASKRLLSEIKTKINEFRELIPNLKNPKIAIILVGDNLASRTYINSKIKSCENTNIESQLFFYPETISEYELVNNIKSLQNLSNWDGIIIEFPLPNHINRQNIINALTPEIDIDGCHPLNFGKMALGIKSNRPATAYGILKLLEFYQINTQGKHIVVIGRSNVVGKPISIMLGNDFNIGRATVTTCDKNTPIELLKAESIRADIIIVAAGQRNLLTDEMVKEGSIVIDVGINFDESGNLVGDCDFENLSKKCEWITPVPGGVGPMTVCALLLNTYESWKNKNNLKEEELGNKKLIDYTVKFIEQNDSIFNTIRLNKKFIGTYDHNRMPKNNMEIIQVIGDYPTGQHSMITNNPSHRHYKWALKYPYDEFEAHPCWDKVDVIYIINDSEREDRLYDTLKEFKKMGVPLNKVKVQQAQYDNSTGNPYANRLIGCFKSHLKIFEEVSQSNYENIMIVEDDITFTDPMEENQKQISEFFERKYDYDVLLLSTSAVGKIVPKDDLISISNQPCTTTAGYIISKKGLAKVLPLWHEGINGLLYNCDYNYYACDKYWTRIQKDNGMLVFNRKIGYQRPAYSTTLKTMNYNLD